MKISKPVAGVLAALALIVCVVAFMRVGADADLGQTIGVNDLPDYQGQIDAIQNNPNIPADKKAIAIGAIRSHMTAPKTMNPNTGNQRK